MDWLNDIAKRHDEWVRMVNAMGEFTHAEDVVQEMYIKLVNHKDEREFPQSYIWLTLRSILCDMKKGEKIKGIPLEDLELPYEEENDGYKRFLDKLNEEMNTWHSHERKMFKLYIGTYGTPEAIETHGVGMSIRKLKDETGLSFMHIVFTLQKCKKRIRENLGEDWEDYLNDDIELI